MTQQQTEILWLTIAEKVTNGFKLVECVKFPKQIVTNKSIQPNEILEYIVTEFSNYFENNKLRSNYALFHVHTHPNMDCTPSTADVDTRKMLSTMFGNVISLIINEKFMIFSKHLNAQDMFKVIESINLHTKGHITYTEYRPFKNTIANVDEIAYLNDAGYFIGQTDEDFDEVEFEESKDKYVRITNDATSMSITTDGVSLFGFEPHVEKYSTDINLIVHLKNLTNDEISAIDGSLRESISVKIPESKPIGDWSRRGGKHPSYNIGKDGGGEIYSL